MGSSNGTYLHGVRIGPGECPLSQFNVLRFGDVTVAVEILEGGVAEPGEVARQPNSPRPSLECGRTLWKAVVPGNRPLATPAVVGGRVFVGGGFGSHEFYAFAADTGELLWEYHTKDDGPTAAVVEGDLVAFNTESCELEVLTVDGRPVWKKWLGDPLTSMPAAARGRVYIAFPYSRGDRRHYLACFDLRTGDEFWRQPVGFGVITAPVLAEGNVYVATVDGTLWCFRQDAGTPLWWEARNATSSPSVWNGRCYYSRRRQAYASGPAYRGPVQNECLSSSATLSAGADEDYDRTLCQADYLDYSQRQSHSAVETICRGFDSGVGFHAHQGDWNTAEARANLGQGTVAGAWSFQGSRPFAYRGRLYNCMGAFVQCVEPSSGRVVWRAQVIHEHQRLVDHALTPPVPVNGKVFVGTLSGEVVCLAAETGDRLWSKALGGPIGFQPAVAGGRVYVPTRTGSLYCLDARDAGDDGWLMWGGSAGHNGAADESDAGPASALARGGVEALRPTVSS